MKETITRRSQTLFSGSALGLYWALSCILAIGFGPACYGETETSSEPKVIEQTKLANERVTEEQVQKAIADLDNLAEKAIADNSVAGLSLAVVYKDKMIFSKGYGLRDVGKADKVDADTVFLLASVSKPVGSTVVAELVGEGKISWDSKISDLDPTFKMYDPWVTREITIRDFYMHRSGLPDHGR